MCIPGDIILYRDIQGILVLLGFPKVMSLYRACNSKHVFLFECPYSWLGSERDDNKHQDLPVTKHQPTVTRGPREKLCVRVQSQAKHHLLANFVTFFVSTIGDLFSTCQVSSVKMVETGTVGAY
jgi:hypothetical protein